MSSQITLLTPDNSFLEALFISNSLYQELIRITRIFDLEHLNLAFLREIKNRAIALVIFTTFILLNNSLAAKL